MSKELQLASKQRESISARMLKYRAAFDHGQLRDHPAISAFADRDAIGQRGWGPMMQT